MLSLSWKKKTKNLIRLFQQSLKKCVNSCNWSDSLTYVKRQASQICSIKSRTASQSQSYSPHVYASESVMHFQSIHNDTLVIHHNICNTFCSCRWRSFQGISDRQIDELVRRSQSIPKVPSHNIHPPSPRHIGSPSIPNCLPNHI